MKTHIVYGGACGLDQEFARWAAERIDYMDPDVGFGPCTTIAVTTGTTAQDRLLAVIVYHAADKANRTIQVSIVAADPRWASRANVREILGVAFTGWKCRKVWAVIAHTNERARKLCGGLGFRQEGILRDQLAEKVHAVVYGMKQSEFNEIWMSPTPAKSRGWRHRQKPKVSHGQEIRAVAA